MAVSLDQFSKQLADSGVMTDSDLKAFIETLPVDVKPTDGEQLAKRLVREQRISAYQAVREKPTCGCRAGAVAN